MVFAGCIGQPEESAEEPTVVHQAELLGTATPEEPFTESVPLTEDTQAVAVEVSITNTDTESPAEATVAAYVNDELVWGEMVELERLAAARATNETRSAGDERTRLETDDDGPEWAEYVQEEIPVDGDEADELTLVVEATNGTAVVVDGWLRAKSVPSANGL